jgi:hypothetical protein
LDSALDRARETLDEVKELTDYQDSKATRLLTIVTFLSALAGVLFARLVESYPVQAAMARPDATWLSTGLRGTCRLDCRRAANASVPSFPEPAGAAVTDNRTRLLSGVAHVAFKLRAEREIQSLFQQVLIRL